jgi:hypothetical protein
MRRTTTSKRSIRAVLAASVLLLSCPAVAAAQLSEISTHLRSQVEQGLTVDLDEEAPRWDRRMKPARRMKLHHHSKYRLLYSQVDVAKNLEGVINPVGATMLRLSNTHYTF